jgi:2-isopropylmalate synthase
VSRTFDELLNRSPNKQAPYVGKSAFATKAGIHASAILKEPETYEHVRPESVGNRRQVLVSDQAGKSNLLAELQRIGLAVAKDDSRLDALLREVKEREAQGYAYDGADASFELLARRALGTVPKYFDVLSFRVIVEERDKEMISEAVVKVRVDDEIYLNAGEGNGPVNALDVALRKDLGKYQSYIADMELVDFKVRILNGGTGATTRVLIESRDGQGNRWFTVGVSPNIVDASFQALSDSITYRLVRAGVPVI